MKGRRIAIVGDLMLDRYIWGNVSRISPEAPVPVIDIETEQARLGGAANVARNIMSLGGEPLLVGVVGEDTSGRELHDLLHECGFPTDGVIVDRARPTTVKTRVIAHSQHVVRIDRETKAEISYAIQQQIISTIRENITTLHGIIIEDYNKGVIVRPLISELIALAQQHNTIVAVDPKFNNFLAYMNVNVFKPNRNEVEQVLGIRLDNDDVLLDAGRNLLKQLRSKSVLLTLGEHGMVLFEDDGSISRVPTKARNVADVSGAGDTVIASMTMALAAGASMKEAATLANFAGGIVCGYVGIVPVETDELRSTILSDGDHLPRPAAST
jgi:rfaE bifunctional protein kinase chain/domain